MIICSDIVRGGHADVEQGNSSHKSDQPMEFLFCLRYGLVSQIPQQVVGSSPTGHIWSINMKCDHSYPFVVRVSDTVVFGRIKKNGCISVDRHLDCIFCGPRTERIDILPVEHSKKHNQNNKQSKQ